MSRLEIANFVVSVTLMELLAFFVFLAVRRAFTNLPITHNRTEIWKGLIERLVLFSGLLWGAPHILTFFSALKLANRLKSEDPSDDGRNYFLIGNLLSVLLVFAALVFHRDVFPLLHR